MPSKQALGRSHRFEIAIFNLFNNSTIQFLIYPTYIISLYTVVTFNL